jgi:hypothetical protein
MSKFRYSSRTNLRMILVLGSWLACARSSAAETDTVSSVNERRKVAARVAQLKSTSQIPSQTGMPASAVPTAAQVKPSPGQKNSPSKKSDNRKPKTFSNAKTTISKPQRAASTTAEFLVEVKEQIQAMQQARAELLIKQGRAQEVREQLRATLWESRAAPLHSQRETIVDTAQRAEELKTKLIGHKEALDEASLRSKGRNRRGIDQGTP